VTPIPAPTNSTVSKFKKFSLALPNGPSTMTRGRIRLSGGFAEVPTTLPPAGGAAFAPFSGKSHPRALAKVPVKSPTIRI
jgi:hypothetical protein